MKKITPIVICFLVFTICFSCKDSSPVQRMVDEYQEGKISEDSILKYLTDSINHKPVIDWAEKHWKEDIFASYVLGRAYKLGLGVERNPQKSKIFYGIAANEGNINAMQGLAHLYADYPGHENLDSAFYWYNKAAESGNGASYYYLGQLEVIKKTKMNLPIDTALIISYWEKGYNLNDASCLSALASYYYLGIGVELDKTKAFNMLSLTERKMLDKNGLYLLGVMYELGDATQQNFNVALQLFRESSQKGNTDAMCKLGNFYQFGQGIEKNDSLAFIEYNKAANAGNPWGMRCVGTCYYEGVGVEQNIPNAWQWYKNAARQGDIEAQKFCDLHNVEYNK